MSSKLERLLLLLVLALPTLNLKACKTRCEWGNPASCEPRPVCPQGMKCVF